MATQQPHEPFYRSLNESKQSLLASFQNLRRALVGQPGVDIKANAKQALKYVDTLTTLLASSDRPQWIETFRHSLSQLISDPNNHSSRILVFGDIERFREQIKETVWDKEYVDNLALFSIDEVLNEAYRESDLSKVFDQLVRELEKIVQLPEFDSISGEKRIRNLLEFIRRNIKNPSRVEVVMFVVRATCFSFIDVLSDRIPVIKESKEVVRKTIAALDEAYPEYRERAVQGLKDKIGESFGSVPERFFLEPPKLSLTGSALPSDPKLPDNDRSM